MMVRRGEGVEVELTYQGGETCERPEEDHVGLGLRGLWTAN